MGQLRDPDLGLSVISNSQHASLPYLHHKGELSITALARLPKLGSALLLSRPWGWLVCTHAYRASSTVLPSHNTSLAVSSAAACKGLGQISNSQALQGCHSSVFANRLSLLCCPCKVQGLLTLVIQPVMGREDSNVSIGRRQGQVSCSYALRANSPDSDIINFVSSLGLLIVLFCCCHVSWRSCSFGLAGLALASVPTICR